MLAPDGALADTAMADGEGATTIVVAFLVDVTITFDVTGALRAGQSRTLEGQAVMMTSLVLITVVPGMTVVLSFMLEEIMLDEAMELLVLLMELGLAVLLMALMLCQLPLLSVYSYCIAGLALVILTLLMYEV